MATLAANPIPEITLIASKGRIKYGFGLNVGTGTASRLARVRRLGWNDGTNESFAYTGKSTGPPRLVLISGAIRGIGRRTK